MALAANASILPGQFFTWNAEYATHAAYTHTVADVLVVALDIRPDLPEPQVIYVVRSDLPTMAACGLGQFRGSCSPAAGAPWATAEEIHDAATQAQADIAAAVLPGVYAFLQHPSLHADAAAQGGQHGDAPTPAL